MYGRAPSQTSCFCHFRAWRGSENTEELSPALACGSLNNGVSPYGVGQGPNMADRVSLETAGMDNYPADQLRTSYADEGRCTISSNGTAYQDIPEASPSLLHHRCTMTNNCRSPHVLLNGIDIGATQNSSLEETLQTPIYGTANGNSYAGTLPQTHEPPYTVDWLMSQPPQGFYNRSLLIGAHTQQSPSIPGSFDQLTSGPRSYGLETNTDIQSYSFPVFSSASGLEDSSWLNSTPGGSTSNTSSCHPPFSWTGRLRQECPTPAQLEREPGTDADVRQDMDDLRMECSAHGRPDHMFPLDQGASFESDITDEVGVQGAADTTRYVGARTLLKTYTDTWLSDFLSAPGDMTHVMDAPSPIASEVSVTRSDVSDMLVCDIDACGARFTGRYRKGNFCRHKRLAHNSAKFPCNVRGCEKSFRRQDARLKHHRRRHADDLPLLKPPESRRHRHSF